MVRCHDSHLACFIIRRSLHLVFAVPINKAACHRNPPQIVGSDLAGYRAGQNEVTRLERCGGMKARVYRIVLNPSRSIANMLRWKRPSYRDNRPL